MSDRIRFALLIAVLAVAIAARTEGALGAPTRAGRVATVVRQEARIVKFARRFLGVPYVWGGTSPRSGFDCSGFTRFVYASVGIALPHFTGAQFGMGRSVSRWGLRPGDLVFFDGLGHEGMYIGGNRFIHAPRSGETVSIATLSGWYAARFVGARRLIG